MTTALPQSHPMLFHEHQYRNAHIAFEVLLVGGGGLGKWPETPVSGNYMV